VEQRDDPRWLVWPARAIALGIVLPVRLAWEVLTRAASAAGRGIERTFALLGRVAAAVLRAVLAVLLAPVHLLGRWVVGPLLSLLSRYAGRPVLRLLTAVLRLVVRPVTALSRWIGHAVAVLAGLAVAPFALLWRLVLRPVLAGLAIASLAVGWAWRTAGALLAALGRLLALPFLWMYRHVLTPVGHGVRAAWRVVVRPVRAALQAVRRSARETGAQVRRQLSVLLGRPR
jgi:hypothetical protein